jgi:hypothetical protein
MKKTNRALIFCAMALLTCKMHAQSMDVVETLTTNDGKTYSVEILQTRPANLKSRDFQRYGHWGAEGRNPSFCVSSMKISRGKLGVRLAAKHFMDLCNVNRASFIEKPPFVVLTLEGGDASDSFKAEFKLNGVNLIERAVRDGEFPQVFEITRFNYPVVIN